MTQNLLFYQEGESLAKIPDELALAKIPDELEFGDADSQQRRRLICALPKVETHVHLDGAWDFDYLLKLATELADELPLNGLCPFTNNKLPIRDEARKIRSLLASERQDKARNDFRSLVSVTKKECESLGDFLKPFVFFNAVVATACDKSIEHLEELC